MDILKKRDTKARELEVIAKNKEVLAINKQQAAKTSAIVNYSLRKSRKLGHHVFQPWHGRGQKKLSK